MSNQNRYTLIIEQLFERNFVEGKTSITFERKEIIEIASELGIDLAM